MPGGVSELMLYTTVTLIYSVLYSDEMMLEVDMPTSNGSTRSTDTVRKRRKPQPKVVSLIPSAPKQTTTVLGMKQSLPRAIGTVQYQEAQEITLPPSSDTTSSFQLRERLPFHLVRVRVHSVRSQPQSFESLRVN